MTIEELEAELAGVDAALARIGGCSDGHCVIAGKRSGQHTNGGCRCSRSDFHKADRALIMLQGLRTAVRNYVQTKEH